MTLKIAYFQPTILAIDDVPPIEFSKLYNLVEKLHSHPELDDSADPRTSIRGGQQVQLYPNELNIDVDWVVKYLENLCRGYMEIVSQQSGSDDLKYCRPVVTSIWTIQQREGDYQEMHSHPGGNISGNIYISAPELEINSRPSDSQISFKLPQTKDISKFIMTDVWKYSPTPGSVIVFPSHLPHTVYPWRGKGYRTVVAFDVRLVPDEGKIQNAG